MTDWVHHRKELSGANHVTDTPTSNEGVCSTDSDLILAQMLQLEFDREHDRQLVVEEKHFNKQSKGTSIVYTYNTHKYSYMHAWSYTL